MIYILALAASGTVVVLASIALARSAEAIAATTRIGRLWVGSVILAGATSLPELTTGIFAVRMDAPDLAVGDLFGSSLANMLILALIDILPPRRGVLQRAALDHALAASLAIALNALAVALILVQPRASFLSVGPGSLLLFLGYLAGARAVYRHTLRDGAPHAAEPDRVHATPPTTLPQALRWFALATVAVLLAAPAFAWSARGTAEITGLGNTFVGTALLGLSTSLPELVVSLAAVRMGAFDLAVGNLFGSNAINMALFLPLDLAQPGSLFAIVDPGNAVSGVFGVVLMSVGVAAIVFRSKRRFTLLEPHSLLMIAAYASALWLLYLTVRTG